jgi:hypothetical protein
VKIIGDIFGAKQNSITPELKGLTLEKSMISDSESMNERINKNFVFITYEWKRILSFILYLDLFIENFKSFI